MSDFTISAENGCDLTNYKMELARDRNSRTLSLRTIKRPSIYNLKCTSVNSQCILRNYVTNLSQQGIDIADAISIFESGDSSRILGFLNRLSNEQIRLNKIAKALFKSYELVEPILNVIQSDIDVNTKVQVISFLQTVMMALNKEQVDYFIDNDLCMIVFNLLSEENPDLILATLSLISALCSTSSYARDGMVAFGIQQTLIELAKSTTYKAITDACCTSLVAIFQNSEPLDSTIILESLPEIANLLQLQSVEAVEEVITCMVEMSNKYNQLVYTMYQIGLYPIIYQLLDNEQLQTAALCLIGNMSNASAIQVKTLIDLGLLEKLNTFMNTKLMTYSLWILSNMIESAPSTTLQFITADFIASILQSFDTPDVEIKKEIIFFISTVIVFSDATKLNLFMTESVVEFIIEMLGCGISMVELRCIDTLIKLLQFALSSDQFEGFITCLFESDIRDRLQELITPDNIILAERSGYLLHKIESLSVY